MMGYVLHGWPLCVGGKPTKILEMNSQFLKLFKKKNLSVNLL